MSAEFVVWCPEDGEDGPDDGRTFTALDHAGAAEAWAARCDSHGADYHIVGGRTQPVVHVQSATGEVQRFRLHGEAVPQYWATQKVVPVTLTIRVYETVPEDWDEESIRFFVEENHCIGNYLDDIARRAEQACERLGVEPPVGVCQVCSYAEARVGHYPFPTSGGP